MLLIFLFVVGILFAIFGGKAEGTLGTVFMIGGFGIAVWCLGKFFGVI